ncbi:MAG: pyrroline-5-carboxylate reductase [Propionibacteriaceae bacterium]|nr:pyrroline-5-carboxylate reductase [Propionibacteriaceae bacterium]
MDAKDIEGAIALIGSGTMGEALLAGLLGAGVEPHHVRIADPNPVRLEALQARYGVATAASNADAAFEADVVLLAVKPNIILPVLTDLAKSLRPDTLVISIAAGVTLAALEGAVEPTTPVVRLMPNTPARVGAGMTAVAPGRHVGQAHLDIACAVADAVGQSVVLDERYFDAVTAVSGSGPAYVFLVAEAMVDAGVQLGLTRDIATRLTTQTLLGSAQMLAQDASHPAVLRNQVTSPGGTTAAALAQLEAHGVRTAFTEAMQACARRSVELGG